MSEKEYQWIVNCPDLLLNDNNLAEDVVIIENSNNLPFDFFKYSNDFFTAANELAKYLLNNSTDRDIGKLDTWFFALIYTYRHSIELIIKSIIFTKEIEKSRRIEILQSIRHDLIGGFEIIIGYIPQLMSDQQFEKTDWLRKYLDDISTIDRKSDLFRYPFDTNMNTIFCDQHHFNLLEICNNFNAAYLILSEIYENSIKKKDIGICKIRRMPHSNSGVCRTVIPGHAAHSFRTKAHTF